MSSKVISTDLYGRFQKKGLRNPATADAYRKAILAPGGSKHASEMIQDFLGRPLRFEAYEARLNAGE